MTDKNQVDLFYEFQNRCSKTNLNRPYRGISLQVLKVFEGYNSENVYDELSDIFKRHENKSRDAETRYFAESFVENKIK